VWGPSVPKFSATALALWGSENKWGGPAYSGFHIIRTLFVNTSRQFLWNSLTGVVRSLMITLLQFFRRVCQWKNFENRSVFAKVTTKLGGVLFRLVYVTLRYISWCLKSELLLLLLLLKIIKIIKIMWYVEFSLYF